MGLSTLVHAPEYRDDNKRHGHPYLLAVHRGTLDRNRSAGQ